MDITQNFKKLVIPYTAYICHNMHNVSKNIAKKISQLFDNQSYFFAIYSWYSEN